MVPSAVVVLEQLTLLANGKLDRRALPSPRRNCRRATSRRGRAGEDTAVGLAGCAEASGHRGGDNFFLLGGDSILSLQIVARAREAGLRVTPRQLFEHPTVEGSPPSPCRPSPRRFER